MNAYYKGQLIGGVSGGSGDGSSEEVYSTEEVRIGTWIDGKPLYRRVISGTTPTKANSWTVVATVPNIEFKFANGNSLGKNGNHTAIPGNLILMFVSNTNNTIHFDVAGDSNYLNSPFELIVEYTKSTD